MNNCGVIIKNIGIVKSISNKIASNILCSFFIPAVPTTPAATTPAATTPAATTPDATTPAATTPAATTPAATTPDVTTPAATTPAVTTPAETPTIGDMSTFASLHIVYKHNLCKQSKQN